MSLVVRRQQHLHDCGHSGAEAARHRRAPSAHCDVLGPRRFDGRMDPEDLREVISAYQTCVAESVHRFGGFVAKYMGDGVRGNERGPKAASRGGSCHTEWLHMPRNGS
jgi:class 3 adenylate cyclase